MSTDSRAALAPASAPPVKGYELVAAALQRHRIDTVFFLMGGPMLGVASACVERGIRMIDTRHEQGAAMMAHAFARVRTTPGVCMACSGPGTVNLTTGIANAWIDCAPVLALGGSSPISQFDKGAFQEIDQVAVMKPVTKWAVRVHDASRIPEYVDRALRTAMAGKPGPVYLDLPGDVLYADVDPASVRWAPVGEASMITRPAAEGGAVRRAIDLLCEARRPVMLSGSGSLWAGAGDAIRAFSEQLGIPVYTTPQGRGAVPEDHPEFFGHVRSTALREADVVLVVGTRLNYVFGFGEAPRFAPDARLIRIEVDADELASGPPVRLGIIADARVAVAQLAQEARGRISPDLYRDWRGRLDGLQRDKLPRHEAQLANDQTPIHPLRLCREVRDLFARDAILVVDGNEILNYGRQSIPTFELGNRLNSGPFGIMGVGMPFGVGAKAAAPDRLVVVLHGDGSFGLNGFEIDTAVRHGLPVLVVVSNNGGWTGDPERDKVGRDLAYSRYDRLAESLGAAGLHVERPEEIRPALERALAMVREGRTVLVNVVTDWRARAQPVNFSRYTT
jgi:acetolactate synthase-1/2/3 large subunit